MSLFARVAIAAAAFSLWSTAGIAKEIKWAPKELIGTFHESRERCLSYFENGVQIDEDGNEERRPTHIFNDTIAGGGFYASCEGKQCTRAILGSTRTRNGFFLTMRFQGLYGSHIERLTVTKVGRDRFKFQFSGGEPFTLVRCSRIPFEPDP